MKIFAIRNNNFALRQRSWIYLFFLLKFEGLAWLLLFSNNDNDLRICNKENKREIRSSLRYNYSIIETLKVCRLTWPITRQ